MKDEGGRMNRKSAFSSFILAFNHPVLVLKLPGLYVKKYLAFTFFLWVFLWQASVCLGQSPREGYVTAPDGVHLFYKVVGSGAETLVAVHG